MMFLRNCWYVAGWSYDIATDSLVSRTILGEPIALYRKANGGVVALEDRCCHRLAPLSRGRIEGDDLRFMYHGLKFAPSGKCVEVPGQDLIPEHSGSPQLPGGRAGLLGVAVDGRHGVSRPGADPGGTRARSSRLVHAGRAIGL
jgi:vanillate O-demethylase monooxygenase subunit